MKKNKPLTLKRVTQETYHLDPERDHHRSLRNKFLKLYTLEEVLFWDLYGKLPTSSELSQYTAWRGLR